MSLKLKVQKREGPVFACDLDQLKNGVRNLGKDRLVLAGSTLLCALEPLKASPGYIAQPARSASRTMPWQRGSTKSVYVQVDKEVLAAVVKARQKPVFAIDALLRYGQRLKGSDEFVILSAFEGTGTTLVQMLHFKKSELVALNEFTLAASSSHTFETDLHVLLERLRMAHAQAVFHWCGPLALPRTQSFHVAPASIWQTAPIQNLTLSGRPSLVRRHGLALLLLALSTLAVGAGLYTPYTRYVQAREALSRESSHLQGQYSFASEKLALLRARQAFFEVSRNGDQRLDKFKQVLAVLADEPDTRLREAQLNSTLETTRTPVPAQQQAGKTADFELVVEVLREEGSTALAQSRPLLQKLSAQMGMNLRLSTVDPYKDVDKAGSYDGKPRRIYRIQGDFNRAS